MVWKLKIDSSDTGAHFLSNMLLRQQDYGRTAGCIREPVLPEECDAAGIVVWRGQHGPG